MLFLVLCECVPIPTVSEPTSMQILLWNFFHWNSQELYICIISSHSLGYTNKNHFRIDFLLSHSPLQGTDSLQSAIQPEMQIEHGAIQIQ